MIRSALGGRFCRFAPLWRYYSSNLSKLNKVSAEKIIRRLPSAVMPCRSFSDRTMLVTQSRFVNEKFYDELHFFFMCGAIPCVLAAFLINIVVGQAELVETPENYEPRYWEYYKHPITRFISRNMMWSPQQVYENNLAFQKRAMTSKELVAEEKWFQESELAHRDYRGWQFIPVNPAGVLRAHKEQLRDEEKGDWISR